MCCVIPPASVSTTAVSRIASSSVVLPWSTWPMIVTTGGRASRASSASSYDSGSASSSSACLIVTSRSSSAAISSTSSSESDCVAVFIWPSAISILMICGIETPSACEKSRSVTPDSTVTGPVGGDDLARCPRPALDRAIAGTLALAGAGAPAAAFDHDAALPVAGAAASSWSDGSTAWHESSSVEPRETGVDDHGSAQRSVERTVRLLARSKHASRRQV